MRRAGHSREEPDEQARWEPLLAAMVSMAADLTLEELLPRIVAAASHLAGSRYAAMVVIGPGSDGPLRTFIHHGMPAEQVVEIGDLPTGRGLLGQLVTHPEPLRLHDLAEHAASSGFPDSHPPMSSFLGVPIRTGSTVFGTLYLTEKEGAEDFTDHDQRIVVALAAAAGVAIENARLHEKAAQRERWLAATVEITARLAADTGQEAFQLIVDRAREAGDADLAWIVAGPSAAGLLVQASAGTGMGTSPELALDYSVVQEVARSGHPVVIGDLTSDPRTSRAFGGAHTLGPAIVVPLGRDFGIRGVLVLAWTRLNAATHLLLDPALPANFAEQVSLALQVLRSREDHEELAIFQDRDRIGRDLHDLVIQRLFAVGLGLQRSAGLTSDPALADRLGAAIDDLDLTISDIRRTIFALGAPDDAADIQMEVTRTVDRAAATMNLRPSLRFVGPVRTLIDAEVVPHIIAVLVEALSNAARHAHASRVEVLLSVDTMIRLEVCDDGVGMAQDVTESGLRNMRTRAEHRGGRCLVEPVPMGGTRVRWEIPFR